MLAQFEDTSCSPTWLADGSFLWLSERSGWRHLYRHKADGSLINPTNDSVDDPAFTFFNGALYFPANDGTRGNELWRITLTARSPTTTMTGFAGVSTK